MRPPSWRCALLSVSLLLGMTFAASAGTWADDFDVTSLGAEWNGNREAFTIADGTLAGQSAFPVGPSPLNIVEVGGAWSNYVVKCWINIVAPNTRVCTKGAL